MTFTPSPCSPQCRAISWSGPSALLNTNRTAYPVASTWRFTGVRIVQSAVGLQQIEIVPTGDFAAAHVTGGPYMPMNLVLGLSVTDGAAHSWSASCDVNWLTLNDAATAAGLTSPAAGSQIVIGFAPSADNLAIDAEPATLDGNCVETDTPLSEALSHERATAVRAGLRRLRRLDRETLVAFYVEGRSLAEMSQQFASPLGTIKRRLHVARKRLAAELVELEGVAV